MNRRNMILLALLICQVIAVVALYRPAIRQSAEAVVFFPGLSAQLTREITLTDNNGASIRLNHEGGTWQIASRDNIPVAPEKITAVISKLAGLNSSRLVTRTRGSHARLKVADELFSRRLEVKTDTGTTTLYLGSAPSYQTMHVRLADNDLVYLVEDLAAWELGTEPNGWWQNHYLDIPVETVQGLTLANSHGTIGLARTDDKSWHLGSDGQEDRQIGNEAVSQLLAAAASLTASDYLGRNPDASYGLAKPAVTMTLSFKKPAETETKQVRVEIGPAAAEGGQHVAKSSDSAFYVRLTATEIERLLNASADDFPVGAAADVDMPAAASAVVKE